VCYCMVPSFPCLSFSWDYENMPLGESQFWQLGDYSSSTFRKLNVFYLLIYHSPSSSLAQPVSTPILKFSS
jgi:hypothetical protein